MRKHGKASGADIVPIAERMRYMLAFRLAVASVVALLMEFAPGSVTGDRGGLALATGAYVAASLISHFAWRLSRRGGLALFGLTLLLDGAYLAWASYATGGAASPVRYLIVLHLIAVALLASYRTGMKLALWHSLLLLVVFYAEQAHVLAPVHEAGAGVGTPFQRLLEFSALFWVVALATSTFSAVNERELRRRRYDLEALAAMASRLERAKEPASVADALVESVADAFDFKRTLLLLDDVDGLPLLAAYGDVELDARHAAPGPDSALTGASADQRTRLVSKLDPVADPWLDSLLPGARNLVVVPLHADGSSVGALVAEHPARMGPRIERRVVGMLERFASHGTLALRNARLLEQVRQMAATDGLTGLSNRATFDSVLAREMARAARLREDVALLLLDIDHFKSLNDSHGHQTGDEVLRRVAATIKASCREMDTAARYGGEEFALILPATDAEHAQQVAERVRAAIAEDLSEPRVTASIGVATCPFDGTIPDALVAAADGALYESKRRGRNRVTGPSRGTPSFARAAGS